MICILKYDLNQIDVNSVYEVFTSLRNSLSEEDKLYAIPYGIDILIDAPIEEIINIRNELNEIINARTCE